MNGITTLASLPSGAGQAAHLKPEVGRAKEKFKPRIFPGLLDAGRLGQLGYCVNAEGMIERMEFPAIVASFTPSIEPSYSIKPLSDCVEVYESVFTFPRIEDHSFPFESFDYTERC